MAQEKQIGALPTGLPSGMATEWSKLQAGYLRQLRDMKEAHAEVLIPAAKAAFEEQTERADHLDGKGDRTLMAAVVALGAYAALSRVDAGVAQAECVKELLLAGISALLGSSLAGIFGVFITRRWSGLSPEAFIDAGIIRDDVSYLQRHVILHYLDCFERNAAASERKALAIQIAQVLLVVGVFLMALAAIIQKSA